MQEMHSRIMGKQEALGELFLGDSGISIEQAWATNYKKLRTDE